MERDALLNSARAARDLRCVQPAVLMTMMHALWLLHCWCERMCGRAQKKQLEVTLASQQHAAVIIQVSGTMMQE